jgi:polar amino acid transport system substrate-binding protein
MKAIFGLRATVSILLGCVLTLGSTAALAEPQLDQHLHDLLPERIKQTGVIKVGSPRVIPPDVFLRGDELVGIAVDVGRAMEPILGVKFEWQDMQWPGIIPGLQGGSIDLSSGILSYLPERTKILNIIPLHRDLVGILAQNNRGISADPSSLCGHKIAGLQGTMYISMTDNASNNCVKGNKLPITQQIYANNGTALVAFQAANVEGLIAPYYTVVEYNKGMEGKYKAYPLKDFSSAPISIATAKSENGLADAIEGALQILVKNGTYQHIMEKYGLGDAALPATDMVVKR